MSSWLQQLAEGALTEGVNGVTFIALNGILLLAVLSLLALLFISIASYPPLVPHAVFLLVLALVLWGLIIWFISNVGLVDSKPSAEAAAAAGEEEKQQPKQKGRAASSKQE